VEVIRPICAIFASYLNGGNNEINGSGHIYVQLLLCIQIEVRSLNKWVMFEIRITGTMHCFMQELVFEFRTPYLFIL